MNINFPSISSPSGVFGRKRVQNVSNFIGMQPALRSDVFQKSVSFNGVAAAHNVGQNRWNNATTEKVYNRALENVFQNTPVLKELNIEKPSLKFSDEKADLFAGYDFKSNSVYVYPSVNEPQFLVTLCDEEGKITKPVLVATQTQIKEITESGYFQNNKNLKAIALTQGEKEAYMEAGLAHELRHCVQTHLVASTEGSSEVYLAAFRNMKRDFSKLLKESKARGEAKADITAKLENDLKEMEYGANYKPKKLLAKDTKLKLSLHPKDTRYFSVNEHYLKGITSSREKLTSEAYKALPHEADAFNYQFEYFDNLRQKTENSGVRKSVMNAMSMLLYEDAYGGIMKMPEYGFLPVIFG